MAGDPESAHEALPRITPDDSSKNKEKDFPCKRSIRTKGQQEKGTARQRRRAAWSAAEAPAFHASPWVPPRRPRPCQDLVKKET